MPDSVLHPAPVSATSRRPASISTTGASASWRAPLTLVSLPVIVGVTAGTREMMSHAGRWGSFTRMSFRLSEQAAAIVVAMLVVAALALPSCLPDGGCTKGSCVCAQGARCQLAWDAPPCHVTCNGDNPE